MMQPEDRIEGRIWNNAHVSLRRRLVSRSWPSNKDMNIVMNILQTCIRAGLIRYPFLVAECLEVVRSTHAKSYLASNCTVLCIYSVNHQIVLGGGRW